jgi:3-dehydroquinate synthase
VRAQIKAMGMKCDLKDIEGDLPSAEALVDLMAQDKKVLDGQLRFILARSIGESFVTSDVPREAVIKVIEDALRAR